MGPRIGCCGFPVSLDRYFRELEVVEVQVSFYRQIGERQALNWRSKAPQGFEFILKAPQCVTHPPKSPTYRRSHLPLQERKECGSFRLSEVVKREMETFLSRARILEADKFLFQTPPSFRPTPENLEAMEAFFRHYRGAGTFLWEPRGGEWSPQIIQDLCQRLSLIHATDPLLEGPQLWGDFTYFRLHGSLRTYRHDYTPEEMEIVLELAGEEGYIMFNNDKMWKNALEMKRLIGQ